MVYFVCALVDGAARVFVPRFKPSVEILVAGLPLVLVDLAILWWSFSYLVTTLRETRMRRNAVQHRPYKTFSGPLIACSLRE